MGRGKYSSEQILAILKEQEAGTPVADLCRTYGMHSETFYAWKRRYTGMHSGDVQKLRQMTEENARLRKVVANLSLEVDVLKDALQKTRDDTSEARNGLVPGAAMEPERSSSVSARSPFQNRLSLSSRSKRRWRSARSSS
jgi:putative transposase